MSARSIIRNSMLTDMEKLEMLRDEGYDLDDIACMIFNYNTCVEMTYDDRAEERCGYP